MTLIRRSFWWITVVFALTFTVAEVAHSSASDPASFTVTVSPRAVRIGEIADIHVSAIIDSGWHLYGLTPVPSPGPSVTSFKIVGSGAMLAGEATESAPISAYDSNFDKQVTYHRGSATFDVPVRITSLVQSQPLVEIDYQTCNDRVCLPPTTKDLSFTIQTEAGSARSQYTSIRHSETFGSLLLFLAAAFGAGLLSLVTPCVFPLIPITLTSFVKQADGNKRRLVQLAGGYSLGIIVLYVLVGALTSVLLGASGISRLATNPWVNLFAFAVFLIFALSFFETIRIELPANLGQLQSAAKKQSGWLGLAALGTVFVLASFTCTAPFIGTLLVAAAGGSLLHPLLGMLVFSTAFVSPFLVFSFFPAWITRIPKSGIWLARVKATLGFIEIAASLKFLSNADLVWQWKILTQPVLLSVWALIFFCAALYLFGTLRFGVVAETEPHGARVPMIRSLFATAFLILAVYCFWGLTGRPISPYIAAYLPPAGYGNGSGGDNGAMPGGPWLTNYTEALATARQESKPLFIDFTGYTCTNCRLNEKQVFPDSSVQQELSKFVLVQLYTDGGADGSANEKLQIGKFGDASLPLYGVVDPTSENVLGKTAGVQTATGFATFLKGVEIVSSVTQSTWAPFNMDALAVSSKQGRPSIIDFTANWCTNCKAIERTVFTDQSVKSKLSAFDTYRCDLTQFSSASNTVLEQKYGISSLPAIVFIDRTGREVPGTRVTGLISTEDFSGRIAKASAGQI